MGAHSCAILEMGHSDGDKLLRELRAKEATAEEEGNGSAGVVCFKAGGAWDDPRGEKGGEGGEGLIG